MIPKVNIIIDTNLIFYKFAFVNGYKNSNYLSKPHHRSGLVKDVIRSISMAINNYSGFIDRIIFVADSNTKSWRKDIPIDEEEFYKSTRSKDYPFDIVAFKNTLNGFMRLMREEGIYTYQYDRLEGDDLLFMVSNILFHNGLSSIIFTADIDMYQLIRQDPSGKFIYLFNYDVDKKYHVVPSDPIYLTPNNTQEFNGIFSMNSPENTNISNWNTLQDIVYQVHRVINPYHILAEKIMAGDKSDNVPTSYIYPKGKNMTLTRFTEKRAKDIIARAENGGSDAFEKDFVKNLRGDIEFRNMIAETIIDEVKTKAQLKEKTDPDIIAKVGSNLLRNITFVHLSHKSYSDAGFQDLYKDTKLKIAKDISNKEFFLNHRELVRDGWNDNILRGTDYDISDTDEFAIDFRDM